MPNSTHPVNVELSYSTLVNIYRTLINSPLKKVVSLLILLQPFRSGMAATTVPLAGLNQSPLPANTFDEAFKLTCNPIEAFLPNYDVVTNVPNWEDVKYFLIGNYHYNLPHQISDCQFVNAMSLPGDYLLLEMIDSAVTVECANTCITFTPNPYIATRIQYTIASGEEARRKCGNVDSIATNFSSDLICRGWDNVELHNPLHEHAFNEVSKRAMIMESLVYKLEKEFYKPHALIFQLMLKLHQEKLTLDEQSRLLKDLKPSYHSLRKKARAAMNHTSFTTHLSQAPSFLTQIDELKASDKTIYKLKKINVDNVSSQIEKYLLSLEPPLTQLKVIVKSFINYTWNEIDEMRNGNNKILIDVGIIERNRHAAGVFNVHDSLAGRVFSFFGYGHLIKQTRKDISIVEKTDPQYELRKSLKDKPHAILIPRIR